MLPQFTGKMGKFTTYTDPKFPKNVAQPKIINTTWCLTKLLQNKKAAFLSHGV